MKALVDCEYEVSSMVDVNVNVIVMGIEPFVAELLKVVVGPVVGDIVPLDSLSRLQV